MKVLFLYPCWTGDYGFISGYFAKKSGGTYIPYNLAILAAVAEKEGHEAKIIDGELDRLTLDQIVSMAKDYDPDVIALTGMSPFYNIADECAKLLRLNNVKAKICIGGQHITIMEEKAFYDSFDYGFCGDGEEGFKSFLKEYSSDKNFKNVPGLLYRENGEVKKNPKTHTSKDLDIYPLAAYHLLKMGEYKFGTLKGRLPFSSIMTTRGCPWKCIFCASDQLNTTRILKRSMECIVDEIEHVVKNYNVRHFMVLDDVLTLVRKRTVEFCNAIIERKLNITFEGSTRANLLDEELVILMKKAGLIRLSFGLETVDEDMRKTMNKKVPLEAYTDANRLLNKYDIEALNSVMLGLPGETEENVWKTLNFLKNSKEVKQANFAIAVPYPGTKFHDMASKGEGGMELLTDNLTEYKRYGAAVTNVNNLTSHDLVRLQNEGFVSIYSKYWRWLPVIKKSGFLGLFFTFIRMFIMMWDKFRLKFYKKSRPVSKRKKVFPTEVSETVSKKIVNTKLAS